MLKSYLSNVQHFQPISRSTQPTVCLDTLPIAYWFAELFEVKLWFYVQGAQPSSTFVLLKVRNSFFIEIFFNHLPSNVASYKRRKLFSFIFLCKHKSFIWLKFSLNFKVQKILQLQRTVPLYLWWPIDAFSRNNQYFDLQ